jgi:hypothetical protein
MTVHFLVTDCGDRRYNTSGQSVKATLRTYPDVPFAVFHQTAHHIAAERSLSDEIFDRLALVSEVDAREPAAEAAQPDLSAPIEKEASSGQCAPGFRGYGPIGCIQAAETIIACHEDGSISASDKCPDMTLRHI